MIIKNYWYLAKSALGSDYSPLEQDLLSEPPELMRRLALAEGYILGSWNEGARLGYVFALGVCIERSTAGARIE